MRINGIFQCLFLSLFLYMFATVLAAEETANLILGQQVVQSVELPASTSYWIYEKGLKGIDQPSPLDSSQTDIVRYWIYLPSDYGEQAVKEGAPLLLYLHGASRRGTDPKDIEKVKAYGLPKYLDNAEFQKRWRCVTVSPQCKKNFCWSPAQLMLLLDHIERQYKIDRKRIYVTGVSMGGFGTWMCLQESPKRFAAAAPICGGGRPEWAEKLISIPIWNFHGNKDTKVPIFYSNNIVKAIRKAGGNELIYTVYDGAGHDIWTRTYENPSLFEWLFSHKITED